MPSNSQPATRDDKEKRKWRGRREEREGKRKGKEREADRRGERDRQAMCMGNSNFRSDLNCHCPVGEKKKLSHYLLKGNLFLV